MKSGQRILEPGCGRGEFLNSFRKLGMNCYGVDLSAKAGSKLEGIEVKQSNFDSETLPFEKDFFGSFGISVTNSLIPSSIPILNLKPVPKIFLLETILGPIWVWIVIKEQPTMETILGGTIIILTIAIHSILAIKKT